MTTRRKWLWGLVIIGAILLTLTGLRLERGPIEPKYGSNSKVSYNGFQEILAHLCQVELRAGNDVVLVSRENRVYWRYSAHREPSVILPHEVVLGKSPQRLSEHHGGYTIYPVTFRGERGYVVEYSFAEMGREKTTRIVRLGGVYLQGAKLRAIPAHKVGSLLDGAKLRWD